MIGFNLRPAEPRDVSAIDGLITELAEFEQLAHLGWRPTAWRLSCSARRPCALDLHHVMAPTVRPLQLREP